jgi:hypothetical protein
MAGEFPTPEFSGPQYHLYIKHAKDYKQITAFAEFDDGGVDTNETASDAPQRWSFLYDGRTEAEVKILDDYFISKRYSTKFTFKEPRNEPWTGTGGSTYTTLVQFESYERPDHEHYNIQSRRLTLIKYPV